MNNKECTVNIAGNNVEVFLQGAFFYRLTQPPPFHKHKYPELHFVEKGCMTFLIDETTVTLNAGDVIVIPENTFHRFSIFDNSIRHCAFQLNYPVKEITKFKMPIEILSNLIEEAESFVKTGECKKLSGYIACICNEFCKTKTKITSIQNREFIIHEFFANHYNKEVHLSDIATELNLSEKQAQRMIQRYTGHTFGQELTKHRMEALHRLAQTDKTRSLSEIAQLVGYSSYSGFWKAYNRYEFSKANIQECKEGNKRLS